MSLHTVGDGYTHYVLPASFDSIPESWKSNKTAKPIASSMQTVNVPSLSGNQSLGGSSVIQIPCGAGAGIAMNAYVRFTLQMTSGAAVNASSWQFKGAVQAASCAVNRISSYVNSVQVDNIQNAWAAYDCMLANSTSNDWLTRDATLMLGAGVTYFNNTAAAAANSQGYTFVLPLLGLLGSQQAVPLYLINGTLQYQIDWQSAISSIYQAGATDPVWTGVTISNVQLVYDKIMPEQNFIEKVRHDMMQGAKYVYAYTNLSTVTLPTTFAAGAGTLNLNYGLNVSSLQGVLAVQYNSANLALVTTGAANSVFSISNNLNQFQVSLDGRLISSLQLNSTTDPVLLFSEAQKVLGRLFDASITSPVVNSAAQAFANGGNASGGNFLTQYFVAGASAQRVNEGLAFQGSPCSIMNIQLGLAGTTNGLTGVSSTFYFILLSAFQLLIDATGSVEIVR